MLLQLSKNINDISNNCIYCTLYKIYIQGTRKYLGTKYKYNKINK